MFNPSRDESREFLFGLWEKHLAGAALTPLESMALAIVLEHPEYHGILGGRERYRDREWLPEGGETNPFLHLAMHLAIEEQVSIDQPPGIRAALVSLSRRHGSAHDGKWQSLHPAKRWQSIGLREYGRVSLPPGVETPSGGGSREPDGAGIRRAPV